MDTLELIRTFREVATRGSFSQAARSMDVSKANVSKYVAELESRLGVRLLNRSTRTVSLTDAGALLLERSAPLVEMIELTRLELQQHARQPSGRLRITAPHPLGQSELPQILAAFMERYPQVNVNLELGNRVVDLVEEGFDLALRVGRIQDSSLIVRKLRPLPMVVSASPDYWRRKGVPSHPEELASHEALTHSLPSLRAVWRFEAEGEELEIPVRSRMEANDTAPLVALALRGMGAIWTPRMMVQPWLDRGELQAALEDFTRRDIWLYAAYAQRRHNSAALKAMLAFLEERWRMPDA